MKVNLTEALIHNNLISVEQLESEAALLKQIALISIAL